MDVGCCYSFAIPGCIYKSEFVDPSEIQHNEYSHAVWHDWAYHLGKPPFDAGTQRSRALSGYAFGKMARHQVDAAIRSNGSVNEAKNVRFD